MPYSKAVWDTAPVRGQRPALSGQAAGPLVTNLEGDAAESGDGAAAPMTRLEYIRTRAVRWRRS